MAKCGFFLPDHARYSYLLNLPEDADIAKAIEITERVCGQRPLGIYVGRLSPNSRRLIVEEGGFLYDSDAYDDDLPHWQTIDGKGHLVIPYTLDANDFKFAVPPGFTSPASFRSAESWKIWAGIKSPNQRWCTGGWVP